MNTIVTIGIDLAKNVFAAHSVDATGKPALVRPNMRFALCKKVQERLYHSDVSPAMIRTPVLKVAAGGTASPLDTMAFEPGRTALRNVGD
jgi:hypothetical protein